MVTIKETELFATRNQPSSLVSTVQKLRKPEFNFPKSNAVQSLWPHQERNKRNWAENFDAKEYKSDCENSFNQRNKFSEHDDLVWKEHFPPNSPTEKSPQVSLYSDDCAVAVPETTTIVKNRDPKGYHIVYSSSVLTTEKSVTKKTMSCQISCTTPAQQCQGAINDNEHSLGSCQSLVIACTDTSSLASLAESTTNEQHEQAQSPCTREVQQTNEDQTKEAKGPDLSEFLTNLSNHLSVEMPLPSADDSEEDKKTEEEKSRRSVRIVGVVGKHQLKTTSQEENAWMAEAVDECYQVSFPPSEADEGMAFDGTMDSVSNATDERGKEVFVRNQTVSSNEEEGHVEDQQNDSWTQTLDSEGPSSTHSIGVQTEQDTSKVDNEDEEDALRDGGSENDSNEPAISELKAGSYSDNVNDDCSEVVLVQGMNNQWESERDEPLPESNAKVTRYIIKSSSAFTDHTPQKTTTKKTIKRIIRGSEATGEEKIVEEVIEEVFSEPSKVLRNNLPKGSAYEVVPTVTRTVHETADGQKYLTTTVTGGAGERTYITDARSIGAISSREVVVVPELSSHTTREFVGAAGKTVTVKSTVSSSGDMTRSSQVVKNMSTTTTTTTIKGVKSNQHPETRH